ncbi:putative plant self-incompatibility S1 [Helianthus annuus]|nr:putative plant self-incompatibility S1 [Helianthus annuus]
MIPTTLYIYLCKFGHESIQASFSKTMKFLATWCFLLYLMLHFSSLVNSFDTSSEVKTPEVKTPPSSKWLEPYRIYITDVDVDTIIYQCNAPNAPPVLRPGVMFTWKFRKDLFGENRYDCWFGWLQKETLKLKSMSFNVFDKDIYKMCGRNLFRMNRCYWMISQNGAFFSKRNESFWSQADDNWQLMHQWSD